MSLPAAAPPRLSDIDWRWALPRILVIFVVTRLLVLAVAVAVETTQPAPPDGVRVDERPIIGSLTAWDGVYYVGIAQDGYHAEVDDFPDYAFYPGYPIAVRATMLVTGGDAGVASVLAGNVAFLLALVALYALSVRHLEPGRAILSLWFLSLAPGAIAYALSYSDSLLLLLAACAFLAMELRHGWLAGIALALATLTRVPGILLALPLLMLIAERDGWRPTRAWLPLLLAPLVLLGFYGYLWWLTGDPMAAISAQSFWRAPDPVEAESVPAVAASGEGTMGMGIAPAWIVALWVGSLAFYAFLFVFFRHDRLRPAYWAVAIIAVATVFLSGRLQSAPRYLAVAWPFDWVLANRSSRLGRGVVLVVFAALQVLVLWLTFTWTMPP
ncbi:MAG: mannosyltransferase family protein [Candidatus Limnocylindrales bacterium]